MEVTFDELMVILRKALDKPNWLIAERVARMIAEECAKRIEYREG